MKLHLITIVLAAFAALILPSCESLRAYAGDIRAVPLAKDQPAPFAGILTGRPEAEPNQQDSITPQK